MKRQDTGGSQASTSRRGIVRYLAKKGDKAATTKPPKKAPVGVDMDRSGGGSPLGAAEGAAVAADEESDRSSIPRTPSPCPTPAYQPTFSPELISRGSQGDSVFQALIQALPSRQDIQSIMDDHTATLKGEIAELRGMLTATDGRVKAAEDTLERHDQRLLAVESFKETTMRRMADMQLRMEDQEDRSRRNNLKLRGVPEATRGPDLRASVTAILNRVLDRPPESILELDRVHRVPSGAPAAAGQPRDIICKVHKYLLKEEILKCAWQKGEVDFDGAAVSIFPDLSRQTLYRRRMLKPLLECIRSAGGTYRWGYPLALSIRRGETRFTLSTSDQLPALFNFLECEPLRLPDWRGFLDELHQPTGMPGRGDRVGRRGGGGSARQGRTFRRDNREGPGTNEG